MPSRLASPDKMDWFCRNVLTEIAVYQHAVISGSPKAAHEGLVKTSAAVGQSIRRMEEHLGEWLNGGTLTNQLRKKTIQPNEAGNIVLAFANAILRESECFLERLYAFQHSTEVRLASIHSGWMSYGAKWQAAFEKRVQGGAIVPLLIGGENYPQQIMAAVLNGSADVGITSYPPKVVPPLVFQPLVDREMLLVFSAKYPNLPRRKGPVSLEEVIRQDNKLKMAVHHRYLKSPLGDQVVYYRKTRKADLGPGQLLEVQNIEEIKASIKRFPGTISILPADSIADEVIEGTFRAYSLKPRPKDWKWGLIYRAGTSRQPVIQFIECLRPLFKKGNHKNLRGS